MSILTAPPRIGGRAARGGTTLGARAGSKGAIARARARTRGTIFGARAGGKGTKFGARGTKLGVRAARGAVRFGTSAARGGVRLGTSATRGGVRLGTRAATGGAKIGTGAAVGGARFGARIAKVAGRTGWTLSHLRSASARERSRASAVAGAATGAAGMYFLDPEQGKGRRHVARDRARKVLRRAGRETVRQARHAEGKLHEARSHGAEAKPQPDDMTLEHKVESEIFRDPDAPKSSVNVNAENGVVYLRGEVPSREQIDGLVAATRAVNGVQDVRNLLHVPGEAARTAEDARA
jgi:osmotically-inducible protein OsmY